MQKILLIFTVLVFYLVGGTVDYWQSATEHHKKIPQWLLDYFLIFWLLTYSGVLPFLLIFISSNFNLELTRLFIGAMLVGISIWDIAYSLFDTGRPVSSQKIYFVVKGKNFSLSEKQMYVWHIIRWAAGLILLSESFL